MASLTAPCPLMPHSKRDEAVPELWDQEGDPQGPPWHPMARLQPIISSAHAITPLRQVGQPPPCRPANTPLVL